MSAVCVTFCRIDSILILTILLSTSISDRNYIGKDVPYQLVFQKHFNIPLFVKSVVVAHDVEDFSKIWQAMGRSRTMNDTTFSIYKSSISGEMNGEHGSEPIDIKKHPLTKLLYTRNCDCKMAGNLSSIFQTLIALYNLSKNSFYYSDEIVNTFIEKMEKTIMKKVGRLEEKLAAVLTEHIVPARILQHIFGDKFGRSSNKAIAENSLSVDMVNELVRQIVRQKFEQRLPSEDIYDETVTLEFIQRLRNELKYDTVEALIEQIRKDVEQTRQILGTA